MAPQPEQWEQPSMESSGATLDRTCRFWGWKAKHASNYGVTFCSSIVSIIAAAAHADCYRGVAEPRIASYWSEFLKRVTHVEASPFKLQQCPKDQPTE